MTDLEKHYINTVYDYVKHRYHDKAYRAIIMGDYCEGHIEVQDEHVYLCQNVKRWNDEHKNPNYKHSYVVFPSELLNIIAGTDKDVTNMQIVHSTLTITY